MPKVLLSAACFSVFVLARALGGWILDDPLTLCPFRLATGIPCPLCGLTRAFALATRGAWQDAFRLNAMWPVAASVIILLGLTSLADAVSGRRRCERIQELLFSRWPLVTAVLVIVAIVRFLGS